MWNIVGASEGQGGVGLWDVQDRELRLSMMSGSLPVLSCWAELLTVLGERLGVRQTPWYRLGRGVGTWLGNKGVKSPSRLETKPNSL